MHMVYFQRPSGSNKLRKEAVALHLLAVAQNIVGRHNLCILLVVRAGARLELRVDCGA